LLWWGYFVRASTHSPELLQDIREFPFETFSDLDIFGNETENYHNILQWLKVAVYCETLNRDTD
jgi:hypothetical protein